MRKKIVDKVKNLSYEVLNDKRILTEENFDYNCADNMDSVNRVAILVAIENEFDFIFRLKEITSWNTVKELCEIVEGKMQ